MKKISYTTVQVLAFGSLASVKTEAALPKKFFDPHHHFFDATQEWASYLNSLIEGAQYFPENYTAAVIDPIKAAGVDYLGSAVVEALPDDAVEEAKWIQSLVDDGRYQVMKAYVGGCDLSSPTVEGCLSGVMAATPSLVGMRWLLQPDHSSRTNGTVLVQAQSSDGGISPAFAAGYKLLAAKGLNWDLQCDPHQLAPFFTLAKENPEIPVCINHLGRLQAWEKDADKPNETAIEVWRTNMIRMATLPHVYVKVSMLGHMIPDWVADPIREALVRDLVLETVELFGPKRCMVNTNWWLNAAIADGDGKGTVGPEPVEFLTKTSEWFSSANYSEKDQEWLFWKSAETFYLGKDYEEDPSPSGDDDDTRGAYPISLLCGTVLIAILSNLLI